MRRIALTLLATLTLSACAHGYGYDYDEGHGYGDYRYEGDAWGGGRGDDLDRLDPWLADTPEGNEIVDRTLGPQGGHPDAVRDLNIRFRFFADTNRDMRLTDREIRLALVRTASHGWNW